MHFNSVRRWGQWLLVTVCMCLSAIYLLVPERQAFREALLPWYDFVISSWADAPLQAQLDPQALFLRNGRPLIEYNGLDFLGCDLALQFGQLNLVTYWAGSLPNLDYEVQLRISSPYGNHLVDYTQPLVTTMLSFDLPSAYYAASQRGQIWLKLMETVSGRSIEPTFALRPAEDNGWQPVCS